MEKKNKRRTFLILVIHFNSTDKMNDIIFVVTEARTYDLIIYGNLYFHFHLKIMEINIFKISESISMEKYQSYFYNL